MGASYNLMILYAVAANAKGKLRLVLDLRYINQFLPEQKLKYEGLNLVPQMFEKGITSSHLILSQDTIM